MAQLTLIVSDISNPNGLAFSPDEKTLYATAGRVLRRYDVQADGTVTNGQVFVSMEADTTPGVPDGITSRRQRKCMVDGPRRDMDHVAGRKTHRHNCRQHPW